MRKEYGNPHQSEMLCTRIRIVGDKTVNTAVEINEPIFSCFITILQVLKDLYYNYRKARNEC